MDTLQIATCDAVNGVPDSHYGCHLNTFDFRGNVDLKRLLMRFLSGEKFWLYIHGRTGTGKSHFAVGLYRAIVAALGYEGADSVMFTTWSDLVRETKKSFEKREYDYLVDHFMSSDVLVIDDLGGHLQDYQQRILEEFVRRRHSQDRRLVITSNESYEWFLGLFGEHEVSRIRSVTVSAEFVGPDGRLNP